MSEKRRGLGRGLGALIPQNPDAGNRPVDVFFSDNTPTVEDAAPESATTAPSEAPAEEVAPVNEAATAPAKQRDAAALPTPSAPSIAVSAGTKKASKAAPAAEAAEELAPVPGASFAELPLSSIRPNPVQPRSVFDEDDMAELVHSIKEIGVLQPIVVRAISDGPEGVTHELIMGERRWRASKAAGKTSIPAIVRSTDDDVMLRDALLENLHRSQLNALEEAAAYQQLLDDFGCTQEQLAQRIGRSRPQISNTLRLLKLPPAVARRVAAGVLSAGHARALLTLEDGASQERLAQRIVAEGLSVRGVEEIVALGVAAEPEAEPKRATARPGNRHPQLDDLAGALSDHLDTRAKITLGARKGKITVDFATVEDLHRVLAAMGVEPKK